MTMTKNQKRLVDEIMLATTRTHSYTFTPDSFPSTYTEEQKAKHYQEQRHLFIVEALNTPYEKVTQELKDTWHSLGLRMASRNTGIGKSMQDDRRKYRQASKAYTLNKDVRLWWSNTKTFIKSFMRV